MHIDQFDYDLPERPDRPGTRARARPVPPDGGAPRWPAADRPRFPRPAVSAGPRRPAGAERHARLAGPADRPPRPQRRQVGGPLPARGTRRRVGAADADARPVADGRNHSCRSRNSINRRRKPAAAVAIGGQIGVGPLAGPAGGDGAGRGAAGAVRPDAAAAVHPQGPRRRRATASATRRFTRGRPAPWPRRRRACTSRRGCSTP